MRRIEKIMTNDQYRPFLINNVFNYYANNGSGSFNGFSSKGEGFEFPKGSNKHMFYEDGVIWAGYHKGRAIPTGGGSTYGHGLQPGRITISGTLTAPPVADDPTLARYRVYRVRRDVNPKTTLYSVAAIIDTEHSLISRYESATARQIYDQYIQDWNEWPASDGAPFTDVDSNGAYDPAIDIPGHPGSDQTLWYVANDLDSARTKHVMGSPPIGLEMQRTVWGYNRSGALGNAIFISTLLVNRSGAPIDSMFLAQWADPDLGNFMDDYVGCAGRALGYVYNGKTPDTAYGIAVPAGGFFMLQGPIVASPGDDAIFKNHVCHGFKNLNASAFVFFMSEGLYYDPDYYGPGASVQWYRVMNGFHCCTDGAFIDPTTNTPTKFLLSGDPVTSTGWIDGTYGLIPGDRRFCLASGPFSMAAGDTQELVVAHLAALVGDRISSISLLRYNAGLVGQFFVRQASGKVDVPSGHPRPAGFSLAQNYPNPFNPFTTITYELPESSLVRMTIFDLLGREVQTLVDERKSAGSYEVKFDGAGLSSGVYFYRLTANDYVSTKKFLLLR